jgi:Tfp pilus assembly PilM family ATPase
MSALVAIDSLQNEQSSFRCVVAHATPEGKIRVEKVTTLTLSDESTEDENTEPQPSRNLEVELETEIDATFAVIPPTSIYSQVLSLPFKEESKLNSVVPLQLQDVIPFEVNDFILDTKIVSEQVDGNYNVLSTIAPEESVSSTLEALSTIGANPSILTTKASALAALSWIDPDTFTGSYGLLTIENNNYSLALFTKDQLKYAGDHSFGSVKQLATEIKIAMGSVEQQFGEKITSVWVDANDEIVSELKNGIAINIQPLEISSYIEQEDSSNSSDILWAIGLFAKHIRKSSYEKKHRDAPPPESIDFRKGRYAYKGNWKAILNSLTEEKTNIILIIFCFLLWMFASYFSSAQQLAKIDDAILSQMQQVITDEAIPYRQEAALIQQRVSDIQSQLRGLGSSHSPLEILKKLSETIDNSIDLKIESLNIRGEKIAFRGTVTDFPSVGRLNSILSNDTKTFCEPKVKPEGRYGARVKVTAEITLCD